MTLLEAQAESLDIEAPLSHYEAQGYARLGRILSDEGLALLRERATQLMQGEVRYPGMFFQLDSTTGRYDDAPLGLGWQGPSGHYRKLEKLELDDRFCAWIQNPLFERIARARIDGPVVLYRAVLFNKGAGGGSDLPWHQDGGRLWGLTRDPELQLWTALDDAPKEGGCVEVIPGSHRGGLASPLGGLVPKALTEGPGFAERIVPLPVTAGEGLLLHNHLWHRSGRGRPGGRRLGFSACYMSAQTRCVRTRKAPRRFFEVFGA